MGSPLPSDPYAALGVKKDATAAAIKTAHRKLILKYHPDKLLSASDDEKEAASNRFVLIQSSYEILSDPARRERYDAQVRLAELRKEAMNRQTDDPGRSRGPDSRSAPPPYKTQDATRSAYATRPDPRMTPQYEERRPSYAADYFEPQPRPAMRKEPEYERPSRRSAPESKEKSKTSSRSTKDNERERRREKTRKAERDTRRERERKYTQAYVGESESDSDEYQRNARRMREEDEEQRARDAYYAQMYKQRREAEEGNYDDRTRKMFEQTADVREYIARGAARQRSEQERRPSPVRMSSSKEKVEHVRRGGDGRPAAFVRHSSAKTEKSSKESNKDKESRKTSSRAPERRSSAENVEERRPPNLKPAKSSPAEFTLPTEKPRAASLQPDTDAMPMPSVRRSETMPAPNATRRSENMAPKASGLRETEFNEGVPTPAMTPEYQQGPSPSKFTYGVVYADDNEYPTPSGYRQRPGEPDATRGPPNYARKATQSPPPVRESRDSTSRDLPREPRVDLRETGEVRDPRPSTYRTTSSRYPSTAQPQPPPLNTRTTSYRYNGGGSVDQFEGPRPSSGREQSPRDTNYKHEKPLWGEIGVDNRPASGSPRHRYGPFGPPDEGVNSRKTYRPEDVRVQTGYNTKRSERPALSRNASGNGTHSYQQQPIRGLA